jgi:hypothetical protein
MCDTRFQGAEPGASHMCARIYFHTYVDVTPVSKGQSRVHRICVPGSISTHMLTSQVQYIKRTMHKSVNKIILTYYTSNRHNVLTFIHQSTAKHGHPSTGR